MEVSTHRRGSGPMLPFGDKLAAVIMAAAVGLTVAFVVVRLRRQRLLAAAPAEVKCHACQRVVRYTVGSVSLHLPCPYCQARIQVPEATSKKPEHVEKVVKSWGGAVRRQRDERRRRPGAS
jgi:hypothetical protein